MGIETERFSKSIFRLLKTPGISISNTHIVIDERILRIDPAGSVQGANSLLKTPGLGMGNAQIKVQIRIIGIELSGLFEGSDRFIIATQRLISAPQVKMGIGMLWIVRDSLL